MEAEAASTMIIATTGTATDTASEVEVPALSVLFADGRRESIAFDCIGAGQDFGECMQRVTVDFDLDMRAKQWRVYQLCGFGDGSWMGVWLGEREATAENLLASPVVSIWSDDVPELRASTTLGAYIARCLRDYARDPSAYTRYGKYSVGDESDRATARAMLADVEARFPMTVSDDAPRGPFEPPVCDQSARKYLRQASC